MSDSPDKLTERIVLPVSKELLGWIEAYRRKGERIPSRATAMRELIEFALKAQNIEKPK